MNRVTIGEIVEFVEGSYKGPSDRVVTGVAPLAEAGDQHLGFLSNPKYAPQLETTAAAAVLVSENLPGDSPAWIRVKDPYYAMARVVGRWFASRPRPSGVSPLASIDPTAQLGEGVAVGPFSVIGANVRLGRGVVVYSNVAIEAGCTIGDDSIVYPQVSVYHGTHVGKRCVVHSGVVIGSDGYGFATHGGRHHKIPQVGIVRIEDDVEIGAGTTIDRAALGETVIGEGTKIDNLVQIGHNVKIGKHCFLVSQVGVAGSTELGDYVAVAGQSGFSGHLKIGDRVQVAAKSAVLGDVAAGEKVMGIPAVPFREFARREAALRRLTRKRRGAAPEDR